MADGGSKQGSGQAGGQDAARRLGERVKELAALHAAARLSQNDELGAGDLLQAFAGLLPPAWQFPEIAAARVACGELRAETAGFRESPWSLAAQFKTAYDESGLVQVVYLEERPMADEGPFLAEERKLIDTLAELLRSSIERRISGKVLRASEERFRALVTHSPDAIYTHVDGTVTMANPAMGRLLGVEDPTGLVGRQVLEIVHADHHAPVRERWSQLQAGQPAPTLEEQFVRQDKTVVDVEVNAVPLVIQGRREILVIARDITFRKRAERHIRQLNRVYAVRSGINQLIVREKDPERMLSEACRIAVEDGGFRMAWIGLLYGGTGGFEMRAHAGADAPTLAVLRTLIASDPPAGCAFTRHALTLGEHGICNDVARDAKAAPWRDEALARDYRAMASFPLKADGRTIGTFNFYVGERGFFDSDEVRLLDKLATDVGFALEVAAHEGERKRAATTLLEIEGRLRGAFDFAPIGMALVAPDGKWLQVNRALCEIVGYTEAEMLALDFQTITHPDDLEADLAFVNEMLEGRRAHYQMEKRYVHKLGQEVCVLLSVSLVRSQDGRPSYFVSQIQNISERKRLEDQLRQAQKMEAVGQLAGGVAHDFNNLLTVINGYATLMQTRVPKGDERFDMLRQIKEAGDRAASLTRQLLAFSRKQVLQVQAVDLNRLVANLERMLGRLIGEDVNLETRLGARLGAVRADPSQIEQALMNLAVNARDAMPHGGALYIETENVDLDEAYARPRSDVTPGRYVLVTVRDTGSGMTDDVKHRIFEPFFTTKGVGKGTGLGMAVVHGVVKQSGGHIEIESAPGRGTAFKIYLPQSDEKDRGEKPVSTVHSAAAGSETILLVEDDSAVRELTASILAERGYHLLLAGNGEEGLRIAQEHDGPVHLLLTDVVMPVLDGRELAERLKRMQPGLKVLYLSGYTDDAIVRRGIDAREVQFLQKPYSPSALALKIREVLDTNG